jgi:hypothetical protein
VNKRDFTPVFWAADEISRTSLPIPHTSAHVTPWKQLLPVLVIPLTDDCRGGDVVIGVGIVLEEGRGNGVAADVIFLTDKTVGKKKEEI